MKHTYKNIQRSYKNILFRKSIPALVLTGLLVVLLWIYSGSAFNYSETWQTFTTIGITIVTFILVWMVQHEQARNQVERQPADVTKELA